MKVFITLVATCLMSLAASANDFAAAVGFRSTSGDYAGDAVPGLDVGINSKTGFGAGVIGFFDLAPKVELRTGFLYNQRNFGATFTSGGVSTDVDMNISYIDIPVTAMYKFADYAGAFAGPVLGLLASKECKVSSGTCTVTDNPESTIFGFQFGASFKFAPQLGAELYYEMISTDIWKNALKNGRTVGANLLFTFE